MFHVSALRASGRLNVSVTTGPARVTRTSLDEGVSVAMLEASGLDGPRIVARLTRHRRAGDGARTLRAARHRAGGRTIVANGLEASRAEAVAVSVLAGRPGRHAHRLSL